MMIMYNAVLVVSVLVLANFVATEPVFENYEIERVNVNFSQVYEFQINSGKEYVLVYPNSNLIYPHRVSVWSRDATPNYPAMIVLRQERSILSWQVPLPVDSQTGLVQYRNTSRTLCHDNIDVINSLQPDLIKTVQSLNLISQTLLISLATADVNNVTVHVVTNEETQFYVQKDTNYSLVVSPSQPRFVHYTFDESDTDSMLIYVDSADDICLTVSIQESQCPVMDLNKDIKYQGKYATIDKTGGIPIQKREFPDGFFLVFVANSDNFGCSQESSLIPTPTRRHRVRPQNRTSVVTFVVQDSVSKEDYLKASFIALAVLVGFALVSVVLTCVFFKWGRLAYLLKHRDEPDGETNEQSKLRASEVEQYLCKEELVVTQLSIKPTRNKRKSFNYLWHVNSIAIFYSIPVVQLVITYQRVVNISGDLDMCYYNFLCAHPALGLSDFNHVFSNVGYILTGVLYMGIILYRQSSVNPLKGHGIPIHYGFFYAMGMALIIEGILSACYHICPSQSSYQFDLSFMYIMAILIMVKLYHNRHPDINASAYATFNVIGIGIFAAMVGILNGTLTIWILFIIFYVWFCIYLSLKIYFLSYVVQGLKKFKRDVQIYGFNKHAIAPIKKARFLLLILANLFNYTIVILGVLYYLNGSIDFGTFLLATLLANAVLQSAFYISMKLIHKEQICAEAAIFGVTALILWGASGYFFFNYSTQWTLTPAQSREHNTFCVFLRFYDSHDIWHMLSAGAMFMTFMFLLTLDDDLALTPQETIPVF